jgi:hypothetical protein
MLRQLAHILDLILSTGPQSAIENQSDREALSSTLHPGQLLTIWWPEGFEAQTVKTLREASNHSVFSLLMQASTVYQARAELHLDRHRLLADINACIVEFYFRKRRHLLNAEAAEAFIGEIRDWLLVLPLELFPELTAKNLRRLGITTGAAEWRIAAYHNLLESIGGYMPDEMSTEWV